LTINEGIMNASVWTVHVARGAAASEAAEEHPVFGGGNEPAAQDPSPAGSG
jgi:hypothetical protein